MKRIIKFLEKYFVPIAGRFGSQRHMVAIRDGFVSIIPLIIIGSLAVLVNNLPIPDYQRFMITHFGRSWNSFGNNIYQGTFSIMSLLIVFTISYNLAKSYNSDSPITAGLVSFAALMTVIQPAEEVFAVPYRWIDASGLFVAIFIAIISTEIMVRLLRIDLFKISMPEGVPPEVARSFAALVPTVLILSLFAALKVISLKLGVNNIHLALYNVIQKPLSGMANTLWSAIIIVFLMHLFWFLGLHGSNILEPVIQAIYLPALQENINSLSIGSSAPNIFTKPFFDTFVYMGGAGATISLITAILIASRREQYRNISKLSLAQGIFNINEPVLFGLPIVMNPILLVPFLLVPVILTVVSYLFTYLGIVPPTIAMVPWTTPPLISGFLVTGSIMGSFLQVINIVIGTFIYLPFVVMGEKN